MDNLRYNIKAVIGYWKIVIKQYVRQLKCRGGRHRDDGKNKELYITAGFAYWERRCPDCGYIWYVLKETEDESG